MKMSTMYNIFAPTIFTFLRIKSIKNALEKSNIPAIKKSNPFHLISSVKYIPTKGIAKMEAAMV